MIPQDASNLPERTQSPESDSRYAGLRSRAERESTDLRVRPRPEKVPLRRVRLRLEQLAHLFEPVRNVLVRPLLTARIGPLALKDAAAGLEVLLGPAATMKPEPSVTAGQARKSEGSGRIMNRLLVWTSWQK